MSALLFNNHYTLEATKQLESPANPLTCIVVHSGHPQGSLFFMLSLAHHDGHVVPCRASPRAAPAAKHVLARSLLCRAGPRPLRAITRHYGPSLPAPCVVPVRHCRLQLSRGLLLGAATVAPPRRCRCRAPRRPHPPHRHRRFPQLALLDGGVVLPTQPLELPALPLKLRAATDRPCAAVASSSYYCFGSMQSAPCVATAAASHNRSCHRRHCCPRPDHTAAPAPRCSRSPLRLSALPSLLPG